MNGNRSLPGHLAALFSVVVWGTTFISTKILLRAFAPVEILFIRFCIGFLALALIYPRRLRGTTLRQELQFAAAGLSGVTLYFLFENIALTYTLASNVGVICSVAPFFTAILAHRFLEGERLHRGFFLGFAASMAGIVLITFNGSFILSLNPLGDLLAVLATLMWAVYSIFTRRIASWGLNTIQTTRRIFGYGLLFMLPALPLFGVQADTDRLIQPINLFNLLFLGLGASALCFVTWNLAVRRLGAVKTSVYIYMVPVVTIVTSVLVLGEPITWIAAVGTSLTIAGLFLSQKRTGAEGRRDKGNHG